jgi:uncharacterized protein (TIGR03083 family)
MSGMEVNEHIDQLEAEGLALAAAAGRADLDALIPYLPGWTVRDVIIHVGGIHRWATGIVAEESSTPETAAGAAVGTGPGDDELVEWFVAGHAGLVDTLRRAPRDVECFIFLPAPSSLAFWARRQALETAVHRADVEAVPGPAEPLDHELAIDGIDELLLGFGARPRSFEPGLIRLEPAESIPWDVTLGTEKLTAVRSTEPNRADVTVSGDASDVYLWLWNRPANVAIIGDLAVAEQWKRLRVRWV